MKRKAKQHTTIDDYLRDVAVPEHRLLLEQLRETMRKTVPLAEECISYGIPAFRLDGAIVGGFAATTKGCSYYPFSGSTLTTLRKEIAGYSHTKSALHFGPEHPLPASLVRKLVADRRAEKKKR